MRSTRRVREKIHELSVVELEGRRRNRLPTSLTFRTEQYRRAGKGAEKHIPFTPAKQLDRLICTRKLEVPAKAESKQIQPRGVTTPKRPSPISRKVKTRSERNERNNWNARPLKAKLRSSRTGMEGVEMGATNKLQP